MYPPIQFFNLCFLNLGCFQTVIFVRCFRPSLKLDFPKYLYAKRRRGFVPLSTHILRARRRRMFQFCTVKRYSVRSTSTGRRYSFFQQRSEPGCSTVGKPSSLTAGSILSFFLYLLLSMGSVHLRRIRTAIPVQGGQVPETLHQPTSMRERPSVHWG